MNDPWHQDVLDGLVAYVEAARDASATAWAVLVVSSERLGGEAVAELRGRLGGVETLRLCTYLDPRRAIRARLDEPRREAFRATSLEGLSAVLEAKRGEGLLTWLNFNRESFERPGEAFVFVLSREMADRWAKEAPDLDRYTQHFELVDWDDLVESAQRAADEMELEGENGEVVLRRAEEQLEHARTLGGEPLVRALVDVGWVACDHGLWSRAEQVIGEALALTDGRNIALRGSVALLRALLHCYQGRPDEALRETLSTDEVPGEESLRSNLLGLAHFCAGNLQQARLYCERDAALAPNEDLPKVPLAECDQWNGMIKSALRRMSGLAESSSDLDTLASLLLDTGETSRALELMMKSWRRLKFDGSRTETYVIRSLAQTSFRAAHPRRCVDLTDDARALPGSKSALVRNLASTRAEALWTLYGPAAVTTVIHEEEQRQRGWTAPIPAAELTYIRGLASTTDEDARRHLQDAADRYRAMEGLLHLGEIERHLARLDRLHGDLDRAAARIEEGLTWHVREGTRPREARDRTELAMIALGRGDPKTAREQASQALELIRACGTRLDEPAALVALAAAERALGHHDAALAHDDRWRRLVRGIDAKGLEAALERDAAWARTQLRD